VFEPKIFFCLFRGHPSFYDGFFVFFCLFRNRSICFGCLGLNVNLVPTFFKHSKIDTGTSTEINLNLLRFLSIRKIGTGTATGINVHIVRFLSIRKLVVVRRQE
jgi:hypothetical protein